MLCSVVCRAFSNDLWHSSSKDSPNQLAHKIWSHHQQLHASTQVDANSKGGVEMGATGRGWEKWKRELEDVEKKVHQMSHDLTCSKILNISQPLTWCCPWLPPSLPQPGRAPELAAAFQLLARSRWQTRSRWKQRTWSPLSQPGRAGTTFHICWEVWTQVVSCLSP